MRTSTRVIATLALAIAVVVTAAAAPATARSHHHRRHHHHHGHGGGGGAVTLTNADAGSTVRLFLGQTVTVALDGSPAFLFSAPESSDGTVLGVLDSSADPSTGDAGGDFHGDHVGSAQLTSIQAPSCAPQCEVPDLLWEVTVDVVPPPPVAPL